MSNYGYNSNNILVEDDAVDESARLNTEEGSQDKRVHDKYVLQKLKFDTQQSSQANQERLMSVIQDASIEGYDTGSYHIPAASLTNLHPSQTSSQEILNSGAEDSSASPIMGTRR